MQNFEIYNKKTMYLILPSPIISSAIISPWARAIADNSIPTGTIHPTNTNSVVPTSSAKIGRHVFSKAVVLAGEVISLSSAIITIDALCMPVRTYLFQTLIFFSIKFQEQ